MYSVPRGKWKWSWHLLGLADSLVSQAMHSLIIAAPVSTRYSSDLNVGNATFSALGVEESLGFACSAYKVLGIAFGMRLKVDPLTKKLVFMYISQYILN
jgi:hypothetical protein